MRILVTGSSGFIGMNLCLKLLEMNLDVIGIDNHNDYYDVNLKKDRERFISTKYNNFKFYQEDINSSKLFEIIADNNVTHIIHLAAQAGVRYSLTNPHAYIESNISGFTNILEACKKYQIKHLLYASSSSVYGLNNDYPLREDLNTDSPISLYAASKKSNELFAFTYSHLFNIPTTGLRFFTVYGPWGRPDMALFIFTKKILANENIELFNHGNMVRDFTYIDDIVNGIIELIDKKPKDKKIEGDEKSPPYQIMNIGNGNPRLLTEYLNEIEKNLNKKAKIINKDIQPGDVQKTHASIEKIKSVTNYSSKTDIELGIKNFINWYNSYHTKS